MSNLHRQATPRTVKSPQFCLFTLNLLYIFVATRDQISFPNEDGANPVITYGNDGNTSIKGCVKMNRRTKIQVMLSCLCFLAMIYGIASMDKGLRRQVEADTSAMAEEETSEDKVMYLTFDDGPSANTQEVLDILDKYKIKATFFVTGEFPNYADMIKTIHDQGHALGIHTYTHEYAKIYESETSYFEDMQKVSDLILEKTGEEVHIMRFPGGSSNTISRKYSDKIMSQLAKAVLEKGYEYYDWNAHNGDGDPSLSPTSLYKQAMREIKGKNEVMMLMHDGAGNKNTVESLDQVLSSMIEQGWTFKVIEDDMSVFHHHIAN